MAGGIIQLVIFAVLAALVAALGTGIWVLIVECIKAARQREARLYAAADELHRLREAGL